jgi:hypothetical protein
MAITYERALVTPALAKKWLTQNAENNRRPKWSKIPGYARDMKHGDWNSDSGETIKFDTAGTLIDGQNRLMAVILADVPIEFDVAYNVPTEAMQVIDSGASRGAGDSMRIAGATDRMRSAAIVRWAIMWDAGIYLGTGSKLSPTRSEVINRYREDPERFNAAATRATDCQNRGLGTGAPSGVAYYLFSRIDGEATHAFFDQYVSGANLPIFSPILALRNKMARLRTDRLTRPEQLGYFIRAWNAVRDDKPLERIILLRSKPGEPSVLTNENFPQPLHKSRAAK